MNIVLNSYPPVVQEVIDYLHKKVHEGRWFSGGYYNAALADSGNIDLLIQTSSTYAMHMVASAISSGSSTFQIYEGTTFSSAGTAVTMSNHNRSSAKVFSGTVTHTPTITAVGTQINGTGYVPGSTKSSGGGGEFGFQNEFILAASTTYLFRSTNNSGATAKTSIHIECYQPTL
jgi:hypothetical protein